MSFCSYEPVEIHLHSKYTVAFKVTDKPKPYQVRSWFKVLKGDLWGKGYRGVCMRVHVHQREKDRSVFLQNKTIKNIINKTNNNLRCDLFLNPNHPTPDI